MSADAPCALSIVIPVLNDAAALRRCLAAVAGALGPDKGDVEIIVVDGGVDSAARDAAKEFGAQYLNTRFEPEVDSRGQTVVEPFGNKERLAIARAGVYLGSNLGRRNNWNTNIELMFDDENRITQIYEPLQDVQKMAYVFKVEARRGLV